MSLKRIKSMSTDNKTRVIVLMVLFIMFIGWGFIGCTKTTQVLVEKPKTIVVEKKEQDKPEFFIQKKLEGISSADSIILFSKALFYSSCEISIEKALGGRRFITDNNGRVLKTDSINAKQKIVPQGTSGGLLPNGITTHKDYRGIIMSMAISFSRNDASYKFTFFRRQDGRFELSGVATITIDGEPHEVIAKTKEVCYLLFYFDNKQVIDKTIEQAEGWGSSPSSGNNIKKVDENGGFIPSYDPNR